MNEHGEVGWEPDASRGVADTTYGNEEERPTGANSYDKLHSNEPKMALEPTSKRAPRAKLQKLSTRLTMLGILNTLKMPTSRIYLRLPLGLPRPLRTS